MDTKKYRFSSPVIMEYAGVGTCDESRVEKCAASCEYVTRPENGKIVFEDTNGKQFPHCGHVMEEGMTGIAPQDIDPIHCDNQ